MQERAEVAVALQEEPSNAAGSVRLDPQWATPCSGPEADGQLSANSLVGHDGPYWAALGRIEMVPPCGYCRRAPALSFAALGPGLLTWKAPRGTWRGLWSDSSLQWQAHAGVCTPEWGSFRYPHDCTPTFGRIVPVQD